MWQNTLAVIAASQRSTYWLYAYYGSMIFFGIVWFREMIGYRLEIFGTWWNMIKFHLGTLRRVVLTFFLLLCPVIIAACHIFLHVIPTEALFSSLLFMAMGFLTVTIVDSLSVDYGIRPGLFNAFEELGLLGGMLFSLSLSYLLLVFQYLYNSPWLYYAVGGFLLVYIIGFLTYMRFLRRSRLHIRRVASNNVLLSMDFLEDDKGTFKIVKRSEPHPFLVKLLRLGIVILTVGIVLSFWVVAIKFFVQGSSNKDTYPWRSRLLNKACVLWTFDAHDMWHMYASYGFVSMGLLVFHLSDKPRNPLYPTTGWMRKHLGRTELEEEMDDPEQYDVPQPTSKSTSDISRNVTSAGPSLKEQIQLSRPASVPPNLSLHKAQEQWFTNPAGMPQKLSPRPLAAEKGGVSPRRASKQPQRPVAMQPSVPVAPVPTTTGQVAIEMGQLTTPPAASPRRPSKQPQRPAPMQPPVPVSPVPVDPVPITGQVAIEMEQLITSQAASPPPQAPPPVVDDIAPTSPEPAAAAADAADSSAAAPPPQIVVVEETPAPPSSEAPPPDPSVTEESPV